ncbi:hypothetical protein M495_07500 [Serratia liquefaciens ATCC 27592]|nr:hypothetical protein M495_07500 [Serratia liquefaciens ATCC 27592]
MLNIRITRKLPYFLLIFRGKKLFTNYISIAGASL